MELGAGAFSQKIRSEDCFASRGRLGMPASTLGGVPALLNVRGFGGRRLADRSDRCSWGLSHPDPFSSQCCEMCSDDIFLMFLGI